MNRRMDYRKIFRLMLRNFQYMKEKRVEYILGGILTQGRLALAFIIPYLYKQLIDMHSAPMTGQQVLWAVGAPFALLLVLAPLISVGDFIQKRCAHWAAANMQKAMFYHVARMSVQSLETGRGDKLTRATENTQRAASMLGGFTVQFLFQFIVYFFSSLVLLLAADWRFALMGTALSALVLLLSTFLNTRLRALERGAQDAEAAAATRLLEMIKNIPIVKLYMLESRLTDEFQKFGEVAYKGRMRYSRLRGVTDGSMDFLSYSVQAAALLLGITMMTGSDFGSLVYVAGLLNVMLTGVRQLGFFIQFIQRSIVSSERMYELLDEPEEEDRASAGRPDPEHPYAVEFERVDFSYIPGQPVIRDLNLKIPRGRTTAIVGPSGCGKSTLMRLMERLYAPDAGEIKLFGAPQRDLSNGEIRDLFALIPQDADLFDGTVAENLALSGISATEQAMERALHRAALTDLPLETEVGEGGAKLSGGQKQRVAIARAFLREAPIYLLDEATSALDVNAEAQIQETLRRELAGRTVIIVAHRLSTIVLADEILYMESGSVTERGTHLELRSKRGGYWRLYTKNEGITADAAPHS